MTHKQRAEQERIEEQQQKDPLSGKLKKEREVH